jgi:Cu/Ag efflux protein CusF
MSVLHWLSVLVFAAALLPAGCGGGEPKGSAEKDYPIEGKVTSVDLTKPAVKLDHEDVPGLMKGMEMEFAVENGKILEGIQAGDQVQGRLKVHSGRYVISQLEKSPSGQR